MFSHNYAQISQWIYKSPLLRSHLFSPVYPGKPDHANLKNDLKHFFYEANSWTNHYITGPSDRTTLIIDFFLYYSRND